MLREELIRKSPIRVLEKSIHGGVGKGNLGVFTARKGVGKTGCLVHVATDKLLNGKKVVHISFAQDPHHIANWYKQVFQEVAAVYKLENALDVYDEIIKHRLIFHFKQHNTPFEKIREHISVVTGSISLDADCIIIDGLPFENIKKEQLKDWKEYARELNIEIWFSAVLHRENLQLDENGIPAPVNCFSDLFSVIIMLNPQHEHIEFLLLKDHDSTDLEKMRLKLDPKTMLIANHRV